MLRNVSQDDSYVFKVPICQTLNDADIPLGYPLHRMHRLPPPPPLFLAPLVERTPMPSTT